MSKKMDKYKRQQTNRALKNKVLVLCGGKTEEVYFKLLVNHLRDNKSTTFGNITIDISSKGVDQLGIVSKAINMCKNENYHEVWVVFDKDDGHHLDDAVDLAKSNEIKIAYSNKAFEYWILLHLVEVHTPMSVNDLISKLGKMLGFDYKKNVEFDKVFKAIIGFILVAEERAKARHQLLLSDGIAMPSKQYSCTTVYNLTKRLSQWCHGV